MQYIKGAQLRSHEEIGTHHSANDRMSNSNHQVSRTLLHVQFHGTPNIYQPYQSPKAQAYDDQAISSGWSS